MQEGRDVLGATWFRQTSQRRRRLSTTEIVERRRCRREKESVDSEGEEGLFIGNGGQVRNEWLRSKKRSGK